MARGLLPGALSLSAKFMPALRKVTARVVDSGRQLLAEGGGAADRSVGGDGDARAGSCEASGVEGGGVRRPGTKGLRSRGSRLEVELAESEESFATRASRKDD